MTLPLPETITLHEIRVPFREPLVTTIGTFTERRSVLVSVSVDGVVGWGEAAAFPSGRWGTADEAWDALVGMESGRLPSVPIAAAALQAARADAAARRERRPLHVHLGGRSRAVRARHTIGLAGDIGDLVDRVGEAIASGVRAVKVKVAPGNDIVPVLALRATFEDLTIGVDANGTYDDPEDIAFDALDHLGVDTIDQPFPADAVDAHAALRPRVAMQVCLDESITSVAAAVAAMAAHAADVVSVKIGRMGMEAAAAILASARTVGVGFKVGGTFDTAIGRRHLLAWACRAGVSDAEVAPPLGYLAADVADYPDLIDGTVTPDDAPGIGAEPDHDRLAALEVRRAVV